jgi:hypothetical protein
METAITTIEQPNYQMGLASICEKPTFEINLAGCQMGGEFNGTDEYF